MMIVVTGGAASGKSQIAEEIAMKLGGQKAYIATMQPSGQDGAEKIARHTKLRYGKGFVTLEQYTNLAAANVQGYQTVLLECMSNLLANEIFSAEGAGVDYYKAITDGIEKIKSAVPNLILVTNEVFSDGIAYEEQTAAYQKALGDINAYMGKNADVLIESVAGIPVYLKGAEL